MRKRGIVRVCCVAAMAVAMMALTASQSRRPRFEQLYDVYIIVDAEATGYDDGDFEQVDYEDFLAIIGKGRKSCIAFEPAWQVNLFDDDGIRYSIYISRTCCYFRIDSNFFSLSRSGGRRLRRLLGAAL